VPSETRAKQVHDVLVVHADAAAETKAADRAGLLVPWMASSLSRQHQRRGAHRILGEPDSM
jgi:hypothetical protein